jgi:hypothetical protein
MMLCLKGGKRGVRALKENMSTVLIGEESKLEKMGEGSKL